MDVADTVVSVASLKLVKKLRQMIARGTHDAVLTKLAVFCINCVCSHKETVVADLFQVCLI